MKACVCMCMQRYTRKYVFPGAHPFICCPSISQSPFYLGGHCGCYLKHDILFFPLLVNSYMATGSQLIANEPIFSSLYVSIPQVPPLCHT